MLLSPSDDALKTAFFALHTREDVARLLEVDDKRLIYHLYICSPEKRYLSFDIPKKAGGVRCISAPATTLKILQQKLNYIFQLVYEPKPSVHGFIIGKSILTNSKTHAGRRYILNVDLKDFFPSINFGRVRGLFMNPPYALPSEAATLLAQICCFDNALPQGAPTSPVISNMICAKMDSQLQQLAKKHRCTYSRYADDLTFSTSMPRFPSALARVSEATGQVSIGIELEQVVLGNGFEPNPNKIRLQNRYQHQEVTGLTVNRSPNVQRKYIRQIRAMLHAWEKYGLEAAEKEFWLHFDKKHRGPYTDRPTLGHVIKGKIDFLGMVRGQNDNIYLKFIGKLSKLAPELVPTHDLETDGEETPKVRLITEGKTDWKHLKAALRQLQIDGQFRDLPVEFLEYGDEQKMGDEELLKQCRAYVTAPLSQPVICIFDSDNPKIAQEVSKQPEPVKKWGKNVYSLVIPLPSHREGMSGISIEFYYKDADIKRIDSQGRRLFLSDEFNPKSGRHISEDLNCTDRNKYTRSGSITIIDNDVFDVNNQNMALPKSDFADHILNQDVNFRDIDFDAFRCVFDVISSIVKDI